MTLQLDQQNANEIYVHGPGEGRHLHVLDNLGTVKTTADGSHAMSVIEFTAPQDFAPPVHLHDDEDEFLYVLEGELEVHVGDDRRVAPAGAFAWLPRSVPHTFLVRSESARMLSVTAGTVGPPPLFDAMMIELGIDTDEPSVPEPMNIDPGQVAAVCAQHGVTVVGPPPSSQV